MPFRIDVLDAAPSYDRQAALAAVLTRDGGFAPEVADLVAATMPGPIAEVETDAARDALLAALGAAGFRAHADPMDAPPEAAGITSSPQRAPGAMNQVVAVLAVGLAVVAMLLFGVLIGSHRSEPEVAPVLVTSGPPPGQALEEDLPDDPEPVREQTPTDTAPGAWTTGSTSRPAEANGTATLRAIRTGHHDGFDRVVFEFDDGIFPPIRIISGDMGRNEMLCQTDISLEGDVSGTLLVSLGQAFDASIGSGRSLRLPAIAEYWQACSGVKADFKNALVYGVERTGRQPYRTQVLRNPLRLVVDVQA